MDDMGNVGVNQEDDQRVLKEREAQCLATEWTEAAIGDIDRESSRSILGGDGRRREGDEIGLFV